MHFFDTVLIFPVSTQKIVEFVYLSTLVFFKKVLQKPLQGRRLAVSMNHEKNPFQLRKRVWLSPFASYRSRHMSCRLAPFHYMKIKQVSFTISVGCRASSGLSLRRLGIRVSVRDISYRMCIVMSRNFS